MSFTFSLPCNQIGFSTNKEKKPPNVQIEGSKLGIRYKDIHIIVLKPALDRLTFGFCPDKHFMKYAPGFTLGDVIAP